MTLKQYQQAALTTAVYSEQDEIIYPSIGLGEETGEVLGKFKRILRDNNRVMTKESKKAIALELGDCMWYLVVLARDLSYELPTQAPEAGFNSKTIDEAIDDAIILNSAAAELIVVANHYSWSFTMHIKHSECMKRISAIATYLGYSMDDIMQMNIEKLQGRVERNTIHGSGDNR